MKAIASLAFGIASSVGVCFGAASVASAVMADPEARSRSALSSPDLWTSAPKRVDVQNQPYERVAAVYSTYVRDP
jgi:hypothetical protein